MLIYYSEVCYILFAGCEGKSEDNKVGDMTRGRECHLDTKVKDTGQLSQTTISQVKDATVSIGSDAYPSNSTTSDSEALGDDIIFR